MAQQWWPEGLPAILDEEGVVDGQAGSGVCVGASVASRRAPVAKRPRLQQGLPEIPSDEESQSSAAVSGVSAAVPGTSAVASVDVGLPLVSDEPAVQTSRRISVGQASARKPVISWAWKDDAALIDEAMIEWVRCNTIVWADTVQQVLGSILMHKNPRVATDCEGIGAPCEAFRILELRGALGGYHHVMSCEIDGVARSWFLRHHRWPDLIFSDMEDRTWPEGASQDLVTDSQSHLPDDCDIYVCGFPCQPFSERHAGSALFDERKDLCCCPCQ